MREISLYFHIPFCKSKCFYCDFLSYVDKICFEDQYFNAIIKELYQRSSFHGSKVKTIFFGGGSPSIANPQNIGMILEKCRELFDIDSNAEITIECNPESLTEQKLVKYKECGINRLSIGLQAWQNRILKKIGRIHTVEQFCDVFMKAREVGFNNINVDLIFSLPEQSLEDWMETLNEILKLRPEHVSCYSLTLEEGTRLFEEYNSGRLSFPDEDINREMYYKAQDILSQFGYSQYEISNFSKEGFQCKHNLTYWTFGEYFGFGVASHSFYGDNRNENVGDIDRYIDLINKNDESYSTVTYLSKEDKISEYIITGLRLVDGINKDDFYKRFNVEIDQKFGKEIKKFVDLGMMKSDHINLKLTQKGFDVSNSILCEFV